MGRRRTGAYITNECSRIELSYLIKNGYIIKGCYTKSNLSWTNGSQIYIECKYTDEEKYLRLVYAITEGKGKKHNYDYKIELHSKPSNLGKGEVLYFVCPQSGYFCRVLYMAYSSYKWKSRRAYSNRIYYPLQTSSKMDKYNNLYWQIDGLLKELYKRRITYTYKGKMTKRALRLKRLEEIHSRMGKLRWSPQTVPKRLRLAFAEIFELI